MFGDCNCRRSTQSVEMALSRRLEIWSQPVKSKGNLGKACSHLGESLRNQTPLSANLCLLPFWSSAGGRRTTEVGTNWKQTLMKEDSRSFPSCVANYPSLPHLSSSSCRPSQPAGRPGKQATVFHTRDLFSKDHWLANDWEHGKGTLLPGVLPLEALLHTTRKVSRMTGEDT